MNWFRRMIEASKNPDKFWEDWHYQRRDKRLRYWRMQAEIFQARYHSALSMVAYYQDKLGGSKEES